MPDVPTDRFARIRLLLLDVDGVLTDGRITYTDGGQEIKAFHVRDGLGLKLWQRASGRMAILSGRASPAVVRRAKELGIDPVVQGADEKLPAFRRILKETGMSPDQVCAVGDDLPDLSVLTRCGLAVAVADAAPEVRAAAHYVTKSPGGHGAVRDVVEWLMRGQGTWDRVVANLVAKNRD
jgi:3-deoxy-D-manno-octulosonate 8-phosphate phosphatase (KDO 8-P phosphatase)